MAFNCFYDDVKHERILDGFQGADLGELLRFLDEVTSASHFGGHRFNHSTKSCGSMN